MIQTRIKRNPFPRTYKHTSESWAANWLQAQGLKLLSHNYLTRLGEIDLIMQDGSTIVFIEVKLRTSSRYGLSCETISTRKQQKIIHSAQHYLTSQNLHQRPCRFDAVCIQYDSNGRPNVEWIKNAFTT